MLNDPNWNIDKKNLTIKFGLIVLVFALAIIVNIRADRIEEDYRFSGVVQKITYSDKGTPEVIIKQGAYVVRFPNEDFKKKIKPGDSLIKISGSRIYKLIKDSTKEVFFSR